MEAVDRLLNNITMYRVVLYYLIVLVGVAIIYSFLGILHFDPISLLLSTTFLIAVAWAANTIFARIFEAPTNVESVYITSLILALIITPSSSLHGLAFLGWAAVLAMASKYILAFNKKHIFNPAAISVVITAFVLGQAASWWVGTLPMLPFVLAGGLLVVRKIQRSEMVLSFFLAAIATVIFFGILQESDILQLLKQVLLNSSLFFLGFVMLTEPLTTPPTKPLQMLYGILVGFLFVPQVHVGSVYATPELALIVGNIFAYLVSPKAKLVLQFKQKIELAPDVFEFLFTPDKQLSFAPGQYMEWTLPHQNPDRRGNRRYFTIASSPTERDLRLGIKFYNNSSSFKKKMLAMDDSTKIIGGQLAGDFTLPQDKSVKLAFLAGGIGITPFRSMVKYLLDHNEKRDIVIFYSNKTASEIAYQDVLDQAREKLDIKTVFTLTDKNTAGLNWQGYLGRVDTDMIKQEIPDYRERLFYLSGPRSMVKAFERTLKGMGVSQKQIKIDFFPGFV